MPVGDIEVRQEWSGMFGSASFWVAVAVLLALVAVSWWMASRNGSRRSSRQPQRPRRPERFEEEMHEDEMLSRR